MFKLAIIVLLFLAVILKPKKALAYGFNSFRDNTGKFSLKRLILGIAFIILGVFALRNPSNTLGVMAFYLGIVALIKGIVYIFLNFKIKKETGSNSPAIIFIALVDILLSITFFVNPAFIGKVFAYLLAIWFIIDCIGGLSTLDQARKVSQGYFIFKIIANIAGIVLGIMVIYKPMRLGMLVTTIVGIYFLIFGITNTIEAFGRRE